MKKNLKFLGSVFTVLVVMVIVIFVVNANVIGDVDGNGSVSAADARLALRYAANLETSLSIAQIEAADVNGDGNVTAADARLILRAAANLEALPTSPGTQPTTTKPTTTQAPSYNAPVNGSKAEIVSYYNDAINDAKNYKGNVKVDRRTGSYALIDEFSSSLFRSTAEDMLEPINDWPKAESATFSNGKSEEEDDQKDPKDLLTYLPPSERSTESKLTPTGVKSATCVQHGSQFKVNIQLIEEKGNNINYIPPHHASAMDTLAVTADDLSPFSLNEAEITYSGATIEAIVDAEGRLTSLKIHEPAYIKGKLGYGSFNLINAAIDGGYRYEAMLNYQ